MADFGVALTWAVWIAVWLFVVPNIYTIKTFGDIGFMSQTDYETLLDRIEQRTFGGLVIRSSFALMILGWVRNIGLWVTWSLYILNDADTDGGDDDFIRTLFILINSFIFAGTVLHHLAETTFWQVAWFGVSLFIRVVEFLLFIAAAVLISIEYANLPSGTRDEQLALLIALWIIVGLTLFIWLLRGWLFWAEADGDFASERVAIPTNADAAHMQSAAHMRAAAAMYNAQQAFAKPRGHN